MMHEDPSHEPERGWRAEVPRPLRERVGVSIGAPSPLALLDVIAEAEAAGVAQLWVTQNPVSPDTLTVFAAGLGRTSRVRLGTSIVPTYPRNPLALAQQAATVAALGPTHVNASSRRYLSQANSSLVSLHDSTTGRDA